MTKLDKVEEANKSIDRFIHYLKNVKHMPNNSYWIQELEQIRDVLTTPWIKETTIIDLTSKGINND